MRRAEDTIGGIPLSNEQLLCIARLDSKRTGNLEDRVEIAVGMRAMILANIATEADLANGTRGTVMGIVLDDRGPINHEVKDGATLLHYPPAIVYFKPDGNTSVRLEGFLWSKITRVIPFYSVNLKGQGQTIEYVIVDLGRPSYSSKLDAFGAYVALSRSCSRDTIRLLRGFNEALFVTHPSPDLEVEDACLVELEEETTIVWKTGTLWDRASRN
ncbi:hypothetical protein EV368DRAFT_70482 [Lentinula lateritia]|nr:hypothetical protein EV368DRAFT_70482 [Lentinula lateritia]